MSAVVLLAAEKASEITWPEAVFYSVAIIAGAIVLIFLFKD